jgi:hypothetical protein
LDEPADTIALQPELKAIAKEIAQNSQYTHFMNDKGDPTPGADHVYLTVKWQPHPMDQHGKAQESQYKMDRVVINPATKKFFIMLIMCSRSLVSPTE